MNEEDRVEMQQEKMLGASYLGYYCEG